MKNMEPVTIDFTTCGESVPEALEKIGAAAVLQKQKQVLIKPNLVTDAPHPITTGTDLCRAVIEYVRSVSAAEIIVAEGTGDAGLTTGEVYARLGYDELARECQLELIDLNQAPLRRLENKSCRFFPEIYLPEIIFSHFIISLPVLKVHSLSGITGTMKNMIGVVPPDHYGGRSGLWKKARLHEKIHEAVLELNRYRCSDLTVLDARIGLADYHLGGRRCHPPVGKILAGFDPVLLDRAAAKLLGLDWRTIAHLHDSRP